MRKLKRIVGLIFVAVAVVSAAHAQSHGFYLKDGEEVGAWTKEELAGGINLGVLSTPMLKQAIGVHDLTLKHNDIHFTRWRQVQVRLPEESSPAFQKALEALDALEADLVRQQRAAAQPKAHQYELLPK